MREKGRGACRWGAWELERSGGSRLAPFDGMHTPEARRRVTHSLVTTKTRMSNAGVRGIANAHRSSGT